MSTVRVQQQGKVSVISINRPERRNAMSTATARELQAAFADFDASDQGVAILTGEGDEAFCAGADLDNAQEMWRELWRCVPTVGITTEKPIIAATAGWCVGAGLVLLSMCDLAVAADNTKFMYPEGKVGLFGGFIVGLAARIPHKMAMEMMLLGKQMDAQRAYEIGLVNRVVPKGRQVEEAVAMADQMVAYAPLVLRMIKRFVTQHILSKGPSEHMGMLIRNLEIVNLSEDCKEGVAAFKEKRTPNFVGR